VRFYPRYYQSKNNRPVLVVLQGAVVYVYPHAASLLARPEQDNTFFGLIVHWVLIGFKITQTIDCFLRFIIKESDYCYSPQIYTIRIFLKFQEHLQSGVLDSYSLVDELQLQPAVNHLTNELFLGGKPFALCK